MNCNGSDLAELIKKEFVYKGLDRIRKDGIEKNWKGLYQKGPDWEGLNGNNNILDLKHLDFKKLDWKGQDFKGLVKKGLYKKGLHMKGLDKKG